MRYTIKLFFLTFSDSDGNSPMFQGMTEDTSSREGNDVEFKLTAVPDDSGNFSTTIRIPHVVFFEDDYVVKANYRGFIINESFSIIPGKPLIDQKSSEKNPNASIPGKPSSIDEKFDSLYGRYVSNVKTIIEKVNRISDNLISINTQEKMIDEQSVKARVLSRFYGHYV